MCKLLPSPPLQLRFVQVADFSVTADGNKATMYAWEATGTQRRSVKKTGTVVLHPQDEVDGSFEKLLREVALEGGHSTSERRKSALMTAETVSALRDGCGFTSLLPAQAQCYRGIFRGRDVILHSRTGTGKTLAYALPIIERHVLLESDKKQHLQGPFLLIFVFSNELAHQTKAVLAKVYGSLRFGVASIDDVAGNMHDVVIGTVTALDRAIRGERGGQSVAKRSRTADAGKENSDDDENLSQSSDSDDGDARSTEGQAVMCVQNVRAIVVDEVDTTLGPRFSTLGRCMRNLLRAVRRANGSLSESLLRDFRGHHYVLCGATIPNWVLRATFLGDKKYYYQLVPAGGEKLPPQLRVFSVPCTAPTRVTTAADVLHAGTLGRVVVFGTKNQLEALKALLAPPEKKSTGTEATSRTSCLVQGQGYVDNVRVMDDFNSGATDVVLCTDVAARGIDFVAVDTVLMMSLPRSNLAAETFIHRSGRTARVGRPGQCLVLYDPKTDAAMLEALAKQAHVTFHKSTVFEKQSVVTFVLKVASAFGATASVTVPSPECVLKAALGSDCEKLTNVTHVSPVSVQFSLPVEEAHVVQKKLWKYDVAEVTRK